MSDMRAWRLGTHYGIHVYAETAGSGDDEPVLTALDRRFAEQVVDDHNHVLACDDSENIGYLLRLGRERDELMMQVESLRRHNKVLEERGLNQARHVLSANGELLTLRTRLAALLNPEPADALVPTDAAANEADCA